MNIIRKICVAVLIIITLGSIELAEAANRRHTVQPGQTLYSIAKTYGVTVEAIQAANPSISGTNIPAGMTLIIPDETTTPVTNTVSEAKKPVTSAPTNTPVVTTKPAEAQTSTWTVPNDSHWTDGTLNVAVILPFNLDANNTADNKTQMRSVEFYEGVLLAVDEMQQKGRHILVQTYDLATESLYSILNNPSMLSADFIIAPMEEKDVRQVAEWGESHGTPVVSPFGFNSEMIANFEHLIQVNAAKSLLYPQLSDELMTRFKDYTFIFVTDSVGNKKADPYPAQLKQSLARKGIRYRELSYLNPYRLMACDSILGLKDENLLFVPVTPQPEAMRRMFSGLQHVKILRDARYQLAMSEGKANPDGQPILAVLGYPEWVLNTHDFVNYYYDLNVYMFTKVYASPFDPELKNFYATFKQWYGKEPMSLMPKYGLLGYDVAKYFLESLTRNGAHLEERLESQPSDGLQTMFCFDRSAGRGFYNRGFYLVHFTTESTIEKIEVK